MVTLVSFCSSSAISFSKLSLESLTDPEEERSAETFSSVAGVETSTLLLFKGVSNLLVTIVLSMVGTGMVDIHDVFE